jgi:hypothetical protein
MRQSTRNLMLRSLRDFLVAFMLFGVLVSAFTFDRDIANPLVLVMSWFTEFGAETRLQVIGLDPLGSGHFAFDSLTAEIAGRSSLASERALGVVLAAILFSSIIAFKLAFFRHLRRVHASSRRGAWRGN